MARNVRRLEDSENEDDVDWEVQNRQRAAASRPAKRFKMEADHDLYAGDGTDDDHVDHHQSHAASKVSGASASNMMNGVNGSDGAPGVNGVNGVHDRLRPGSIVRVTLESFVTYDYAVFEMSPKMNMVIGPNGTGKSTLVCGICIGLGFSPNLLGRANKLSDFVKHGAEGAHTTVELKGPHGKPNLVIERSFSMGSETSSWRLNGKSTTATSIKENVHKLNIQIDNLTQFLPQDKVASFAGMTPQMLLRETQRASSDPTLSVTHDKLIEMHKEQSTKKAKLDHDGNELKLMKARNQVLEAKVQRIRQRLELQEELDILRLRKQIAEFEEQRQAATAISTERKAAFKELQETKDARNALSGAADIEEREAQATQRIEAARGKMRRSKTEIENVVADLSESSRNVAAITDDISRLEESQRKEAEEIKTLQTKIDQLQDACGTKPDKIISDKLRLEQVSLRPAMREATEKVTVANKETREMNERRLEVHRNHETLKSQMEGLANLRQRRLFEMGNNSNRDQKDAVKAVKWIEKNHHLFENDVFDPGLLSVSIRDNGLQAQIERQLGFQTLLGFVCQSRKDYLTFTSELVDKQNLELSVFEYSNTPAPYFDNQRRPCPQDQLQRLGLEHWAIDLLEGPAPILNHICFASGLNNVAVSRKELRPHEVTQIQEFVRVTDGGKRMPIVNRFVDSSSSYSLRTSDYHNRIINTSEAVYKKNFLKDNVDGSVVEVLRQDIARGARELGKFQDSTEALKKKESEFRQKAGVLIQQSTALQQEFEEAKRHEDKYTKDIVKLENAERNLKIKLDNRRDYDAEIDELNTKIAETLTTRKEKNVKLAENVTHFANRGIKVVIQNVELMVIKKKRREIEERGAALTQKIGELEATCKRLTMEFKRMQELVKSLQVKTTEALKAVPREMLEKVNDTSVPENERTTAAIGEREAQVRAQLDPSFPEDPGILERYEEQRQKAQELTDVIGAQERELEVMKTDIMAIHADWEPKLQQLVKTISTRFAENFELMGCAGEVLVDMQEAFEDWSIAIMVKFRSYEKLQRLSDQRQSGGERAVSTIYYLMALQGLVDPPFRVVDEINQGMDPRNERLVHARIVDLACSPTASQSFLITPKLLSDLKYHEDVRIHCINSGNKLQTKRKQVDFLQYARKQVANRA